MKRYFNHMAEKQTIKIECSDKCVVAKQDIESIFGTHKDIVEITKSEYIRLNAYYKTLNETNFSMTISR